MLQIYTTRLHSKHNQMCRDVLDIPISLPADTDRDRMQLLISWPTNNTNHYCSHTGNRHHACCHYWSSPSVVEPAQSTWWQQMLHETKAKHIKHVFIILNAHTYIHVCWEEWSKVVLLVSLRGSFEKQPWEQHAKGDLAVAAGATRACLPAPSSSMADKRRFISPFPSSFCFNFNQQKPKMSYIFSAAFQHSWWKANEKEKRYFRNAKKKYNSRQQKEKRDK